MPTAPHTGVTLTPANSPLSPEAAAALDLYLCTEVPGFNISRQRLRREREFARLYALPDAALRAMGLVRADLPRWLFRDVFGWRPVRG